MELKSHLHGHDSLVKPISLRNFFALDEGLFIMSSFIRQVLSNPEDVGVSVPFSRCQRSAPIKHSLALPGP